VKSSFTVFQLFQVSLRPLFARDLSWQGRGAKWEFISIYQTFVLVKSTCQRNVDVPRKQRLSASNKLNAVRHNLNVDKSNLNDAFGITVELVTLLIYPDARL
jgi:hypothetical protein